MRSYTADIRVGRTREAAYLLALALAVVILWINAWSLSVSTRSAYIATEPSSYGSTSQTVATADDGL